MNGHIDLKVIVCLNVCLVGWVEEIELLFWFFFKSLNVHLQKSQRDLNKFKLT